MKMLWRRRKANVQHEIDAMPSLLRDMTSVVVGVVATMMIKQVVDSLTSGTDILDSLEDKDITRTGKALINTGLPLPLLKLDENELLAFRQWSIDWEDGRIKGTSYHQTWERITIADQCPSENNSNGLYAIKLDATGYYDGQMKYRIPLYPSDKVNCCGLVGLKGIVIEHEDGVLRAEYARVFCIWITTKHSVIYQFLPKLYYNYPNIPIFVCTREQAIQALFTIIAQSIRING